MFYKLKHDNYRCVQELFENMDYNLEIESIIERQNGQIFVDSEKIPQTACILNNQRNHYYVAGKANNKEFNNAFTKYILDYIFPTMKETDILDFVISCNDNYWEEEISYMFKQHCVNKVDRRYYTFDIEKANLNTNLPEGYILKRIDKDLLKRSDLKNINEIIRWTSTEAWVGQEDFLHNGFGFCILKGECIVSWCMADYVIGNRCEIGIETDEEFRRKGLATIVVSACIKFCLSNGINHIGWHCFETNIGSIKTAEKVGFRMYKKYAPVFVWFNRFDNSLVQAYICYTNKNYLISAELYENAFRLLDVESEEVKRSRIYNEMDGYWFYFNAARAYAYIGNINLSLDRLRQSIELGLSDKEMLINEDAFKILENLQEFDELLNKIE